MNLGDLSELPDRITSQDVRDYIEMLKVELFNLNVKQLLLENKICNSSE